MQKQSRKFHGASGVYMSGPGLTGEMGTTMEVLFASLVGGLVGFVLGMLTGTLARIFTLNRVRGMIGGIHWAAYGAAAGAIVLAAVEFFD
jgi:hypothetical protein